MNQDLKYIKEHGLKVKSKKKTLQYVKEFGAMRIIDCYGELLKKITDKHNTKNLLMLYEFDCAFASLVFRHILNFEKKLNNIAITTILKEENLADDYVLEISKNPAFSNLRNKGYGTFINDIYGNVESCNLINKLTISTEANKIPLKWLSLSWSFHTTIAFIDLQDERIKELISSKFNVCNSFSQFISCCHSIRKFRNTISHNGIFIDTRLNYFCNEFNYILNRYVGKNYEAESDISTKKLIDLLEYLLEIDIWNEIYNNKLIKSKKLTKSIIEYIKSK